MKWATTAFFTATILLLVTWPWFVGKPPAAAAPRVQHVSYAVHFSVYIVALLLCAFFSLVCAFSVIQRQREEYREEARKNLNELIEGTLRDHEKKQP